MMNNRMQKAAEEYAKKHGNGSFTFLSNINLLYEKIYFEHAKRLFDSPATSNFRRDNKIGCVIFSQLSLEAFINRIGIELVPEKCKTFDIETSLKKDSFIDKLKQYPEIITGKKIAKRCKFWQEVLDLVEDRNALVHAKPKLINLEDGESGPEFITDDKILGIRFNVVAKTVKYLINDINIPHYPSKIDTLVYEYTSQSVQGPPEGKMTTVDVTLK